MNHHVATGNPETRLANLERTVEELSLAVSRLAQAAFADGEGVTPSGERLHPYVAAVEPVSARRRASTPKAAERVTVKQRSCESRATNGE